MSEVGEANQESGSTVQNRTEGFSEASANPTVSANPATERNRLAQVAVLAKRAQMFTQRKLQEVRARIARIGNEPTPQSPQTLETPEITETPAAGETVVAGNPDTIVTQYVRSAVAGLGKKDLSEAELSYLKQAYNQVVESAKTKGVSVDDQDAKDLLAEALDRMELDLLKQRHPDNLLFKDLVSHLEGGVRLELLTSETRLDNIGKQGLTGQRENLDTPLENTLDEAAQKVGLGRFSRKRVNFAYINARQVVQENNAYRGIGKYDELTPEQKEAGYIQEPILLELVVDPDQAIVADSENFAEAALARDKDEVQRTAQAYWDDTCTLREYLNFLHLPDNKKRKLMWEGDNPAARIRIPEVLITGEVQPQYIRFKEVVGTVFTETAQQAVR